MAEVEGFVEAVIAMDNFSDRVFHPTVHTEIPFLIAWRL